MGPNATALGEFIAGSRDRRLPPEIANAAKLCLADWVSVALGAAAEPAGKIVRDVAKGWYYPIRTLHECAATPQGRAR